MYTSRMTTIRSAWESPETNTIARMALFSLFTSGNERTIPHNGNDELYIEETEIENVRVYKVTHLFPQQDKAPIVLTIPIKEMEKIKYNSLLDFWNNEFNPFSS